MNSILSLTKRKKSPDQIVKLAARALSDLSVEVENSAETKAEIPQEELCKRLVQMKVILYGEGDSTEIEEDKAADLSRSIQMASGMKDRNIYCFILFFLALGRPHVTFGGKDENNSI